MKRKTYLHYNTLHFIKFFTKFISQLILSYEHESVSIFQERAAIEAKNNPEAARQNEEKAALDYKGLYYQQ